MITQPGVLVGLNSLLEQNGSITLPTGEVIQRHPDTVVVVTTNNSYEGCRTLNQSVTDRMSLVEDIELPSPEIMAQRAMAVTGATDEYQVTQMVQVVNDMSEYMRKNHITDGTCGMRSLIDWITSAEITGDVHKSALSTIISKASSDEDDREAMHFHSLAAVNIPALQENHEENHRIAEYLAQAEQQTPDEPYGIGRKLLIQELKARLNTFSRSVINAVEEVMEPYGCESESYYEFCDKTEDVRRGYENDACNCIRLPEGTIVSAHDYQIRKQFQIIHGQVVQKDAGQLHHPKRTRKTRKMKALPAYPMKKLYKTMCEYALDYCDYQYDEKAQGYGYYCNPNSMWDWYQIGGRWPVTFLVKDSCTEFAPGERSWGNDGEEYPCPEGYMWVSAARKKDIAWQVMKDWYLAEARKRFQALEAMFLYGTMEQFM